MNDEPKIGPHEDKELALMLKGEKNVAYFSEIDFLPVEFQPYIDDKYLKTLVIDWKNSPIPLKGIIIYRPAYEESAYRLFELVQYEGFDPDVEREIGAILGYRTVDVEYFIARFERHLAEQNR